ncbi:hypothetical protein ACCO45_009072 [Purpureocillium lilacinum]|uniref:Uncharacterized protein n=1 Tax=Purpureocillium lilacinum TaxID=33203 RepID=A0ACC4DIW9_PURLI
MEGLDRPEHDLKHGNRTPRHWPRMHPPVSAALGSCCASSLAAQLQMPACIFWTCSLLNGFELFCITVAWRTGPGSPFQGAWDPCQSSSHTGRLLSRVPNTLADWVWTPRRPENQSTRDVPQGGALMKQGVTESHGPRHSTAQQFSLTWRAVFLERPKGHSRDPVGAIADTV